jgi:hypothetical protein
MLMQLLLVSLSLVGARQPVIQELSLKPPEKYAHSMSVHIFFELLEDPERRPAISSGTGSDAPDGKSYVLTVAHGFQQIGDRIKVTALGRNPFLPPRSCSGTVVGYSCEIFEMDVAVILLDETHFFGSRLAISKICSPPMNIDFFLSSYRSGNTFPTVTYGFVPSGFMKRNIIARFPLRCDAACGESGGGVFSEEGEFIGLLWGYDDKGDPAVKFITPINDLKVEHWIRENNFPFFREEVTKTTVASTPQK